MCENRLEKMDLFFAARLDGYDEHMKKNIEGAAEFYSYTASLLPKRSGAKVLDLGCGTGLELEEYFQINSRADITGIDLSGDMLGALQKKFPDKSITVVCGSYFDVPLGVDVFDAAVSVESLHHFPLELKIGLYKKLYAALKCNGYFVLTDYFAESEKLEQEYFESFHKLKYKQGLSDHVFYHYDTPLTTWHETEALYSAGFSDVKIKKNWGATYTLLASR